jgi:putative membrane protein
MIKSQRIYFKTAEYGKIYAIEEGIKLPHEFSGWGPMGGFPLFPLIFLIFIVLCFYFMSRGGMMGGMMGGMRRDRGGQGGESRPQETPLDILKKRYANGEIDKEKFEEMKKELE